MWEQMRLQKYLAQGGVASRRKAEDMIAAGRVRVNGLIMDQPGYIVREGDSIEADGALITPAKQNRVIMLNKPQGVLTTAHDPQGRTTVMDIVQSEARLFPVGRLDYDTEGLLLLTNDGALAHALTHPSRAVEKGYIVRINGHPAKEALRRLEEGVLLDDGHKTAPARVETVERDAHTATLRVTVHEGHNRLIRRMCAAIGCPVLSLMRDSVGPLKLGHLKLGKWRNLTGTEIFALRQACGLDKDTDDQVTAD